MGCSKSSKLLSEKKGIAEQFCFGKTFKTRKSSVGWGRRICQLHLYRRVRSFASTSVLDMTLNYLMVRLQSWSSVEY